MVRIKHRYLLINVLYPTQSTTKRPSTSPDENLPWTVQFRRPSLDDFDGKLLHRLIKNGVAELFGDYGAGMVAGSLQIKYCSSATSTAIVRVARAHYRLVWAALTFATRLPKPLDEPCVIQVVRVSGTIKKSEEEAIRRARLMILRAQRPKNGARTVGGVGEAADDMVDWSLLGGIEDADGPGDEDDEDD